MNIQRKNSAHHFRMQSEREQTLETFIFDSCIFCEKCFPWYTAPLMSQQGPQFSPHIKAKANDKSTNLRKNVI